MIERWTSKKESGFVILLFRHCCYCFLWWLTISCLARRCTGGLQQPLRRFSALLLLLLTAQTLRNVWAGPRARIRKRFGDQYVRLARWAAGGARGVLARVLTRFMNCMVIKKKTIKTTSVCWRRRDCWRTCVVYCVVPEYDFKVKHTQLAAN